MTTASISLGRRAEIRLSRGQQLALLLGAWAILYLVFNGQLTLAHSDDAPLFQSLNGVRDWVDANRTTLPLFVYVLDPLRDAIGWLIDALTWAFSNVSWIGVTAIFGAMGLSPDTPLAWLWTWGRALRFLDGPDEVHLRTVARQEFARAKERGGSSSAYFTTPEQLAAPPRIR